MAKDDKTDSWLAELPLTSEEIGFESAQMIACDGCGRSNPPNRVACLYCGQELTLSELQKKSIAPRFQKIEDWENGFVVILLPAAGGSEKELERVLTEIAGCDADFVREIVSSGFPIPVIRTKLETEALLVAERLSDVGAKSTVLSDKSLIGTAPPARLKGLDLSKGNLRPIFFNPGPSPDCEPAGPKLIVFGSLYRRDVETVERRQKRGKNRLVDSTEISSDTLVMDVYTQNDRRGYRIRSEGFDFECLGGEKKLTAVENFTVLAELLRKRYPDSVYNDGYNRLRRVLGQIWKPEESNGSQALKRRSFGGYLKKKQVIIGNERQFTMFSRMLANAGDNACLA